MVKWIVPLVVVMFLFASPAMADGRKDHKNRRGMERRGPDKRQVQHRGMERRRSDHRFQSRERPSRYTCNERPSRYSRHSGHWGHGRSSSSVSVIWVIPSRHGTVRLVLQDSNRRPQHRYPFRQRRWHQRRY